MTNEGPFISEDELREAGVPIDPNVNLPTVDNVTLDDDDAQVCRWATKDEIRHLYVDNAVTATPIQPDVWTLEIDNESITFGYSSGASWTTTLAAIDWNSGPAAARYRKSGGIVYPADDGGNVIINASTAPRLANLKIWAHEEIRKRAGERLQMAELVNAFATIIGQYSGAL
jgi:hypothetical protein